MSVVDFPAKGGPRPTPEGYAAMADLLRREGYHVEAPLWLKETTDWKLHKVGLPGNRRLVWRKRWTESRSVACAVVKDGNKFAWSARLFGNVTLLRGHRNTLEEAREAAEKALVKLRDSARAQAMGKARKCG